MPRVRCPHCRSGQAVAAPPLGEPVRHTCNSCGKPFAVRNSSPAGGTQKLSDTPRASEAGAGEPPAHTPIRMGPYEIRGVIGAGGMGIVYRGWDARLNRHVAVKTLKPDLARDPEYCERFLREARSAAALSHLNVTQIYFIGEESGHPFFAMEYLEGKSLEGLVREEGKLPPEQALELVRQAAAGLKAAAARGIIHRDVKPSNLVLTADGTLKVTDFGLAKLIVSDAGLTMAGEVLGSPNYMAPEQASGSSADVRSDIYSLGATFYELVTGRPPFEGPTPVSIILKHVREPVRSPRQLTPDLPYPFVTLIQRMLAKRPEDRPRDYDALSRELDRLVTHTASLAGADRALATPPAGPRAARPSAANPGSSSGTWILVSLLVLALVGGWGLLRQARARTGSGGTTPAENVSGPQASDPGTRITAPTGVVASSGLTGGRMSRPGLDPSPRFQKLREAARANLQFVENTHEITSDGRLRVMGSVANTGGGGATSIRIRILLTDAVGRVIGSTEVPLTPSLLAPRQSGAFEAFFPDPRQPVSIRTELNWNS